tara:strand:- start:566 stop:1021 length:456 start_codon:yes stop_codon:yes gene_type:complete
MLSFPHLYSKAPKVPDGYYLDFSNAPSPQSINKLLGKCGFELHPPKKLALALEKSDNFLSIFEEKTNKLTGFVRVTSDKGLNANLWDISAEPGELQQVLISVLIHRILKIIRKEMPGCSISVASPEIANSALKYHGFLIDPGGIRTMGLKI